MNLESLYKDVIMEHHQHPKGRTPLDEVNGSAHGYNSSCGDEYQVNVNVQDGRIVGIQVDGQGCAISSAAGSMLADVAVGMSVEELRNTVGAFRQMLTSGTPDEHLPGDLPVLSGVSKFPVRVKCASLPLTCALDAVEKW